MGVGMRFFSATCLVGILGFGVSATNFADAAIVTGTFSGDVTGYSDSVGLFSTPFNPTITGSFTYDTSNLIDECASSLNTGCYDWVLLPGTVTFVELVDGVTFSVSNGCKPESAGCDFASVDVFNGLEPAVLGSEYDQFGVESVNRVYSNVGGVFSQSGSYSYFNIASTTLPFLVGKSGVQVFTLSGPKIGTGFGAYNYVSENGNTTYQAEWTFNVTNITVSSVPEPPMLMLFGAGLLSLTGVAAMRRRKTMML
jgi:hypothetical protein